MERPSRSPHRSAACGVTRVVARGACLALGLLLFAACGRRPQADLDMPPRPPSSAEPSLPVLAGQQPPLAAFLAPLGHGAREQAWLQRQMQVMLGARSHETFLSLFLAHIGPDAEPVALDGLSVVVEVDGRACANVPILAGVDDPAVRVSSLVHRALEVFEDQSLLPQRSLEAIVAFDADIALDEVGAARVHIGERVIDLSPARLDRKQLERMSEVPSRDQILASLPAETPGTSGEHR